MKYRARRQALRTLNPEREGQIVLRQRDRLMVWLGGRRKWCPLVDIADVMKFFEHDPDSEDWNLDTDT